MARPRPYVQHGLTPLLKAARGLDDSWIDQLGEVGTALRSWRAELIASLGGEREISSQERAIIELATKTYLLLESVDRWLLAQPSLIHRTRRALFPVVLQRQQLADALARYLGQLGLRRRAKALDLARALGQGRAGDGPGAEVRGDRPSAKGSRRAARTRGAYAGEAAP
jgi:hypothetical protein